MSKIRRIGTLAASLVLAGGFTFAGAQAASAAPSGTITLTAAEMQENYAVQEAAGKVTCAFFPSGWGTVCDIASAASLNNEFQAAAQPRGGMPASERCLHRRLTLRECCWFTVCSTRLRDGAFIG